jgi:hypothetical protein
MRVRLAVLAALLAVAGPARAECLGQGCYDGLLWILAAIVLGGIAILALAIWVIVGAIRGPRPKKGR